jgi:hypothetical protein
MSLGIRCIVSVRAKIAGPFDLSYGSTEKADQKFHKKTPIFHRVAATELQNEKDRAPIRSTVFGNLAPRAGFEPATDRLTVDCSTTELPGIAAQNSVWGL